MELGGTKCVCTLADAEARIVDQAVIATTAPEATLSAIEQTLSGWCSSADVRALGIASFGPVDLDPASDTYGTITSTPKPGWRGTDIVRRLAAFTELEAAFDTDVNGAAMAEILWGAGRSLDDFAYITVGTGVGVGLIVNGAPTRGFAHCELGHIRVARLQGDPWPGSCPYHGDCVEGLASGSAIMARLNGQSAADLSEDDPVWTSVAWTIAQLCHVIVCTAAPHRIAIGGGVLEGQPHLLPRIEVMLRESLAGYMPVPETPLLCSPDLGARAGQLGPIALALTRLGLGADQ